MRGDKTALESLERRLAERNTELRDSVAEVGRLEGERRRLESEAAASMRRVSLSEDELIATHALLDSSRAEHMRSTAELAQVVDASSKLQHTLERALSDGQEMAAREMVAKEMVARCKAELETTTIELANARTEISQRSVGVADRDSTMVHLADSLQAELAASNAEVSRCHIELQRRDEQLMCNSNELVSLRTLYAEAKSSLVLQQAY